jgi:response regulator RpfG family c-di-GMP phosphodiesterase
MLTTRTRVLIVDDEESIRRMLEEHLTDRGYSTAAAVDGREALVRLMEGGVDLVLSDVRMPVMSGLDLLREIARQNLPVGVVMLTACDDVPMAVEAMKAGALDYILKPFTLQQVETGLSKSLDLYRENLKHRLRLQELAALVNEQSRQLRQVLEQLRGAWDLTLDALVAALDAREHEAHAHSKRVSEYAVHLAGTVGVAPELIGVIRRGAMLHDIGKIGIPDNILLKPGKLTQSEWVEMRKHPQIGYWILSGIEALKPACEIVLTHHENYDGTGYPEGLQGEAIPIGARVFSVVDCLDAMTSDRPYRKAVSLERACMEIRNAAGKQFDPRAVERFVETPPEVWAAIRTRTAGLRACHDPIISRLFKV